MSLYPNPYANPVQYTPDPYTYYHTHQRLLEFIVEGITDEMHDRAFYEYLATIAPNMQERDVILSNARDEAKHAEMFRELYRELTGQYPMMPAPTEVEKTGYREGIEKAIFGELGAVEFYRQIYFLLISQRHRDMLFEIITDEQKHATKFTYLYAKNH